MLVTDAVAAGAGAGVAGRVGRVGRCAGAAGTPPARRDGIDWAEPDNDLVDAAEAASPGGGPFD